ncbi:1-phosphatidylinositol 4,5-bisphosphate phosphodiesterase eta-2-like isoform X2 [Haliotis rufescens]|uniref:1-phosphatidylinositol 4,5-bisphosphate phosphodiesterase eta-2-like isoform X2 n=1 Tax=Haliotis rufescens TaxID=6454 RepID=UPI001EAFC471|nr:1-phosphatidylinositol 4,5-bisphosphate phosphodiesterase eta-2-like isoform X2 [Haliotis rufescens]
MDSAMQQPSIDDDDMYPVEDPHTVTDDMDRLLEELSKGQVLSKVKSPTKLLQRKFFLDHRNMIVHYEGSQKKLREPKNEIRISKIREVREGEKDYSKKLQGLDKSLCLAVVMGANHKVVYLMAQRQEIRDMWLRGLRYAIQKDKLAEQRNETDRWVREAFNMADRNGDGALDFDEVMKLLKQLNADLKKDYVKQMFDKADTNKSTKSKAVLDRNEFVNFYHALTQRPELEEIFLRYTRGKAYLTVRDLLSFIREAQRMMDADEETCRSFIQMHEPHSVLKQRDQMSIQGFRVFLSSDKQQLFNPEHSRVYQDMLHPMTHYFIASSHNTYLSEDQLKGPSKVEAYIAALTKGCRCVELDCWDGPDDEPIIYHGYTLTSKILFRDVIMAIKDYAFKATPYPLTLSLENHCSIDQQKVMAKHLTEILGDMLWYPEGDLDHTPNPHELKNRILIKGKTLAPTPLKGKKLPTMTHDNDDVSDEEDGEGDVNENTEQEEQKKSSGHKHIKLCQELSRITGMTSISFKDPEQASTSGGFLAIYSLGENKIEKLLQTVATGINQVSQYKLLRIYPAGTRTDSSNYNPVPMWNHGCQVVALNYQTGSEPMQLNHGRFMDNGNSGYILKPNFLLSEEMFGIVNGTVTRSNMSKVLKILIISGYQIPKPKDSEKGEIIDPFVKIELHGVHSDLKEYRTKTINNNGFNPRWHEAFTFNIRVPELAMLRFVVKDEDRGKDDFIGYYSLPFTSLQEGYRHFPLFDKHGDQFSQTVILAHISITNAQNP